MPKTLAQMILRTAKLHDDSGDPNSTKIREHADLVANSYSLPEMGEIVYYLLRYTWNDSIDWAKQILQ